MDGVARELVEDDREGRVGEPALAGLDLLDHGVEVGEEELAEPPRLLVLGAREAHVDDRGPADGAEQRQVARRAAEQALHPPDAECL